PYTTLFRSSISPLVATLERAPANVLQGAVRLQADPSSPTPETKTLSACPCANELQQRKRTTAARKLMNPKRILSMKISFHLRGKMRSRSLHSIASYQELKN